MKSFDATETTFGYEHLTSVGIKPNPQTGDLEQFLETWDWNLVSMDGAMKNEVLIHKQFYRSIVKHQTLQFHMNC